MASGQVLAHEQVRHEEQQGSSNRVFGLVFATFFGIIGAWPLWRGEGVRIWALVPAGAFLAAALAVPAALAPLNRAWTTFGLILQRVTNPLVMGLVFYAVVTPLGIVMRLTGKDPLRLRRDPGAGTYWIDRVESGPASETMKRQF